MTIIARRALLVALLLLAMSTIVSAQDGATRPVTVRPEPGEAGPQGDVYDTTPTFEFSFEDLPTSITYFNVVVEDNGNEIYNEWYAVSDICNQVAVEARPAQNCDAPTSTSLHPGIGDLDLTWVLSEYDENAETVTEIGSYNFTIKAPEILGPTMFSDPSGSPAFELAGGGEGPYYRVFVLDENNATVMDEWVEVDQFDVGCEPDCTHILDMTQAPLYMDGDYTVYMQGWTDLNAYTAWSEPFTLAADFEAPVGPSLLPIGMFNEIVYIETVDFPFITGTECAYDGEAEVFSCSVSQPTVVISPVDHGTPMMLAPTSGDLEFEYRPYPISNATEWFNVVVETDGSEVYNAWINAYTDERCFYIDDSIGFDDANLCFIQLDALPPGDHVVSWASYNPGGISPAESLNLTMLDELAAPEFDLINDAGWVAAITFNEYQPEWINFVITDTDTDMVVHDEWLPTLPLDEWGYDSYEMLYQDLLDGELTTTYDLLFGTAICEGICQTMPSWYPSNGNFEMTITTWANGVLSAESEPFAFAYDNVAPEITFPEEPMERVAMATVEGAARPIYSFLATGGTAWVNIVVEDAGNNELLNEWTQAEKVCSVFSEPPFGCQWQPELDLVPGDYTWSVRGWSSGGLGNYSTDQMLTISDTALTDTDTVSPNNVEGPYSQFPTFEWDAVANASWHQIQVTNTADNTIVWDEWIYIPADECGETCVYSDAPYVEFLNGNYSWRVRVANGGAVSNWTAQEAFTVDGFVSNVIPWSPGFEFTNEGITFYWLPFASTDWYNLELFLFDPDVEEEPNIDDLEPVWSEWFNENTLNYECNDLFVDVSTGLRPVPEGLPTVYCEYTIPVEDLESGYYVWRVNSWGPTYGSNIAIGEETLPFIIR